MYTSCTIGQLDGTARATNTLVTPSFAAPWAFESNACVVGFAACTTFAAAPRLSGALTRPDVKAGRKSVAATA